MEVERKQDRRIPAKAGILQTVGNKSTFLPIHTFGGSGHFSDLAPFFFPIIKHILYKIYIIYKVPAQCVSND